MNKIKILLVLFLIIGCGAMEKVAEEMQPKVYNIVPGGTAITSEHCDNCPQGLIINALYAVEIDSTAWALGIDAANGCGAMSVGYMELYLRGKNNQGDYERYPDLWVMSSTPSDCYQGVAIWRPIPYLCAAKWCGFTDYWIELYIEMPGDYYIQKFIKPTSEIPGLFQ